jgi:tRNA/tmRNA/rRNA uracil-C5-methylase (TrmA/RlmC/RlmD family)
MQAEDVMKNLLEQYLGEDDLENDDESERVLPKDVIDSGVSTSSERRFTSVVVLVDPPRSGLHPTVSKH